MENIITVAFTVLSGTPNRWQNLVDTIPVDLLLRQPLPNEWSAAECLMHLLDTEKLVFPIRVKAFLSGQNFPAFNPDAVENKIPGVIIPKKIAAEFVKTRDANLKIIQTIKTKDLSRIAIHGQLGEVTLSEMLHEWIGHDLMHTVQAERAILQPFILGCGPWRSFFKDHALAKA